MRRQGGAVAGSVAAGRGTVVHLDALTGHAQPIGSAPVDKEHGQGLA
jgi:hypothetical protein